VGIAGLNQRCAGNAFDAENLAGSAARDGGGIAMIRAG